MRLKYYKISLRQMNIKKSFVFFVITIIVILVILLGVNKRLEPVIKTLCESNAYKTALSITNTTVSEYISKIDYSSLITINQNESGKIVSLNANVMEMNRLTTNISSDIQEKISTIEKISIRVPVGSIMNMGVLSGVGPKFSMSVVPSGTVVAKFNSSFEQAGINQTKHRIHLTITTKLKITAPLYTDTKEYVHDIIVAETILVGDTPSTYYNINGINKDNVYDLIQ